MAYGKFLLQWLTLSSLDHNIVARHTLQKTTVPSISSYPHLFIPGHSQFCVEDTHPVTDGDAGPEKDYKDIQTSFLIPATLTGNFPRRHCHIGDIIL